MMERDTYRIAVLMGGVSEEREVSLHSGEAIARGLEQTGQVVYPVVIDSPALPDFPWQDIDLAFVALHGRFGEDGGIQELLEQRGVPYTGSGVQASENAMDKLASKRLFNASGIPRPSYIPVPSHLELARLQRRLEGLYPVVVKPRSQGSSIGVSIVRRRDQLHDAIIEARALGPVVLVEQYIPGRELTVGILGERALPIIELRPRRTFFDYTAKYTQGETEYVSDPPLPGSVKRSVQELALAAHHVLGCEDFSRVDMMLQNQRLACVLEVNSIPGFTETSLLPKAARKAGISFPELCYRIAEQALARSRLSLVAG